MTGGDGDDSIRFLLPHDDRTWVVDAGRGELRRGGKTVTGPGSFGGFESYDAGGLNVRKPTPWRFVGSAGPDDVSGFLGLRGVDLGGGDDQLDIGLYSEGSGVTFRGGPGQDELVVRAGKTTPVQLDLRRGRLAIGHPHARVTSFEDAVVSGSVLDVVGTGSDNELTLTSCRLGTVRGLGGDDTLSISRFTKRSCQHGVTRAAYGGAGSDTLTGSEDADLLDGGRGHDTADGGAGRDVCRSVETATRCERT